MRRESTYQSQGGGAWPRDHDGIKECVDVRELLAEHGHRPKDVRGDWSDYCCPFHDDHNPSASASFGWFECFGCEVKGDVFELYQRLVGCDFGEAADALRSRAGLPAPRQRLDPDEAFVEWCRRRHLDPARIRRRWRAEIGADKGGRRPYVDLPVPAPARCARRRYLDDYTRSDREPKIKWAEKGKGAACWFGLEAAREHLEAHGGPLYVVNGEPSVLACDQAGVPAVCTCMSEGKLPEDLSSVEALGVGVRVAFDLDDKGRRGAERAVKRLRKHGLDAVALRLPDSVGQAGDVDDLHRRTGDDGLAEALAALPELPASNGHASDNGANGASSGSSSGSVSVSLEEVSTVAPDQLPGYQWAEGVRTPRNYIIGRSGVYRINPKNHEELIPVADGPVVVIWREEDVTTGERRLACACREPLTGRWTTTSAPRDIWATGRLLTGLARYGVPVTSSTASELARYVLAYERANADVLPFDATTSQLGWHVDGGEVSGFQAGASWVGPEPRVQFEGEGGAAQLGEAVGTSGEAEQHRSTVLEACRYGVVLALVGASLSAATLRVFEANNYVVSLSGPTSRGKTAALSVAASVWGSPVMRRGASIIQGWNASRVWIERTAAVLDGLPMVLDDTQTAKSPQTVAEVLYDIPQGRGRGRGTVTGTAASGTFRTVLLSSGETPVLDHSEQGGTRGRVLEVWGEPWGETSPEMGERVRRVGWELSDHHGHLGLEWVLWLWAHQDRWPGWRERWRRRVRELVAQHAGDGAVVGRLCEYLATVEATLKLARHSGVLPVEPDEIDEAVDGLREAAIHEARQLEPVQAAWDLACSTIAAHRDHFFGQGERAPVQGWLGRWSEDSSEPSVYVRPDWLLGLLRQQGHDAEGVVRSWADRGWIECDRSGRQRVRPYIAGMRVRCIGLRRSAMRQGEDAEDDGV